LWWIQKPTATKDYSNGRVTSRFQVPGFGGFRTGCPHRPSTSTVSSPLCPRNSQLTDGDYVQDAASRRTETHKNESIRSYCLLRSSVRGKMENRKWDGSFYHLVVNSTEISGSGIGLDYVDNHVSHTRVPFLFSGPQRDTIFFLILRRSKENLYEKTVQDC
jgi:hypothetical protein